MSRLGSRLLLLVALLGCLAVPAHAELRDHNAVPEEWRTGLLAYGQDPIANRAALDPILKAPLADLPELYLVAVADAELRDGRPRAAVRAYRELRSRDAGLLSTMADVALGTLALELGETSGARDSLMSLLGDPGPNGLIARLLLALDDAGDGNVDDAIPALDSLASAPEATPAVRSAARLGAAYARWWAGQYEAAAASFDLAANAGDPRLADDARYGAARARFALGQEEAARRAWQALAAGAPEPADGPRPSSALLDLEHRAVVRSAARRDRSGPVMAPNDRAILVLDLDGAALARGALARTQWGPAPTPPLPSAAAAAKPAADPGPAPTTGHVAEPASPVAPRDATSAAPTSAPATTEPERRTPVVLVVLLVAALILGGLELRRRSRGAAPRVR